MRVLFGEYLSGLETGPVDAGLRAQGQAMRDAVLAGLRASRTRGRAFSLSCAALPSAPLPTALADVQTLSPAAGESPLEFVQREAAQHDLVWLIAPETDGLLARLSEVVAPQRWLGCSSASIRVAASKSATTRTMQAAGVATPHAFEADAEVAAWVVKPDDGVGASDAVLHRHHSAAQADLARRHAAGQSAVLEPWVSGAAMSLSLLCDQGQAELLSVNRQVLSFDSAGGLVEDGAQPLPGGAAQATPALRQLAQQVAQALPGLFGPVGIDYTLHAARGPVLIEVNPRVTTAWAGLDLTQPAGPVDAALDLWCRRQGRATVS